MNSQTITTLSLPHSRHKKIITGIQSKKQIQNAESNPNSAISFHSEKPATINEVH